MIRTITFALFLSFAAVTVVVGTPICKLVTKDCGSPDGKLSLAVYNGTCKSGTAVLKHGTFVSITFNFTANAQEDKLTSVVHGKIGALPYVPFPLDNPDACTDPSVKCPIPANKTVSYSPVLHVLPQYPKLNVVVKWELQDAQGADVFCALMNAVITD